MHLRHLPLALICTLMGAWGAAALWIDGSEAAWAGGLLVAFWIVLSYLLLVRMQPRRRGIALFALVFLAVAAWWANIPPSNDRLWMADVAHPPEATLDGDRLTIRNVRNFEYRSETDFDENWETRSWDLSKIRGVDFVLSYWGSPWIAHTIVSWVFEEGPPLSISIETRKEQGEEYSALLGFFRQFELFYVVADERDLLGLRTHHRGEEVYMYHLSMPPDLARALLLDYVEGFNALAEQPAWYNAFSQNCTTTIRLHLKHLGRGDFLDWRLLANGRIDELGYERGSLDRSLPFPELRAASRIDEKVAGTPLDADYSTRVRKGLPGSYGGGA